MRLLTKATAIQYAKDGIGCNSIHPGPMVTPITEFTRSDAERYESSFSRVPMGRFKEPEEVAGDGWLTIRAQGSPQRIKA